MAIAVQRLATSVLVLLCLSATGLFAATPATPALVIELIPHPGGTSMMTIHAKVRGHEGNFMFDTGGGISYISPAFAQLIDCKPWGQITGFTLTGQRLDMPRCDGVVFYIGNHHFSAATSGVFDIMKFMPANVPRIDGSIGLDVFADQAVTLSLAKKTLIVESAASLAERAKQGKPVEIRLVREAGGVSLTVYVAVPTVAGMAWMEIDSGNGGANVIGKHLAALLKLDPGKKEPQPASFTIADGIPVEGMARVNETLIMDGNIGTRFLINWDLTVDLANGRAWLTPATTQ
jgi:Aspartyl protease